MCEIIGAGMAGLLAANMLHKREPVIFEAQSELPNNHSAVLRFRSSIVGDTVGAPFRKVQMLKCAAPWRNAVADALAYSNKCTGNFRSDRSLPIQPVSEERYIAPPDFIQQLAHGLKIQFNHRVSAQWLKSGDKQTRPPIISTMPMPNLMMLLGYEPAPVFSSKPGMNILARVMNCDAYVSVYVADPSMPFSRISITGDELIAEIPRIINGLTPDDIKGHANDAANILGLPRGVLSSIELRTQNYQKILPVDVDARKNFIHWATDTYNIFSLGRFATWRPGLLLDDLVKDIRMVDKWIGGSSYQLMKDRLEEGLLA